jgi:hypothetical protein
VPSLVSVLFSILQHVFEKRQSAAAFFNQVKSRDSERPSLRIFHFHLPLLFKTIQFEMELLDGGKRNPVEIHRGLIDSCIPPMYIKLFDKGQCTCAFSVFSQETLTALRNSFYLLVEVCAEKFGNWLGPATGKEGRTALL